MQQNDRHQCYMIRSCLHGEANMFAVCWNGYARVGQMLGGWTHVGQSNSTGLNEHGHTMLRRYYPQRHVYDRKLGPSWFVEHLGMAEYPSVQDNVDALEAATCVGGGQVTAEATELVSGVGARGVL